jgi:hypothetical protein
MPNVFDLSGDFGIGYDFSGKTFYFDKDDFEKIKNYTWGITNHGYVRAHGRKNFSVDKIYMHRLVLDIVGTNLQIDHSNRIRSDNRKENLRISSQKNNAENGSLRKMNTTGIIGIYLDKKKNNWTVRLYYEHHNLFFGRYDNKIDAIIARLKAEKFYYGEFAPQRHLFQLYGV